MMSTARSNITSKLPLGETYPEKHEAPDRSCL